MRLRTLRRQPAPELGGIRGPVRLDRRSKGFSSRARPGDIAVIDQVDLDRASAEALVACRVAAVVDASAAISGRYPNLGPDVLVRAGIPLLDEVGADVFSRLADGQEVRLDGATLYRDETPVAEGRLLDADAVAEAMDEARAGISAQLEALTAQTAHYLHRERDLLLDGAGVPDLRTSLAGRHVVLVARAHDYERDLALLRRYLREHRPVLVGVEGGADALLEAGHRPDLIVGELDSVSDRALRSGAEVVVHAYRDASPPGLDRLERLGVDAVVFATTGTSEDAAMLLADVRGAAVLVTAGSHTSLVEFLDKGRAAMASGYLTRLRVGPKLVDARGVASIYQSRIRTWQLLLLLLAGLLALAVALASTPVGQEWLTSLGDSWDALVSWLQELLP